LSLVPPLERLKTLPRAPFLGAPSPIDRLDRFESAIGSPYPIFIKRDDAIPFGFGGNKVRKLELVMAEAEAKGATTVITCGGLQSNHCRATAAAAARRGLSCHLVLNGVRPETLSGNTRLDDLFGATLHFVPGRGSGSEDGRTRRVAPGTR
jgi:1-aminocyclopropane-1-carboxylate deaminase/D-cysteine desulfhydrase-like pyridoxal-dependent ACC family enzyme